MCILSMSDAYTFRCCKLLDHCVYFIWRYFGQIWKKVHCIKVTLPLVHWYQPAEHLASETQSRRRADRQFLTWRPSIWQCESDPQMHQQPHSSTHCLQSIYSQTRFISHLWDCQNCVILNGVDINRSCHSVKPECKIEIQWKGLQLLYVYT